MIKKAFTLIELIFIIVLIGIMSSVATAYFRDDKLALATYQVLEHIRYAQHLAISEHKFDPKEQGYANQDGADIATYNGSYHLSRWKIAFNKRGETIYYWVYSDRDRKGNCDVTDHIEPAIDPFDSNLMYYCIPPGCSTTKNNEKFNLTNKYGIKSIAQSGFAISLPGIGLLAFDEKGRPYNQLETTAGANKYEMIYKHRLTTETNITITGEDDRQAVITVYPETGYAEITKLE